MFHLAATTIASTALWIVFVGIVYCMAVMRQGGAFLWDIWLLPRSFTNQALYGFATR